eukprot:g39283.t1
MWGEILNEYFALVFTQDKDMEDSEICVQHANMPEHFEMKKEVVLDLLKSIKVDKSPSPNGIYPRSRLTNLIEFFKEVTKVFDEGRAVDIVYMDFSKAFDKVSH